MNLCFNHSGRFFWYSQAVCEKEERGGWLVLEVERGHGFLCLVSHLMLSFKFLCSDLAYPTAADSRKNFMKS